MSAATADSARLHVEYINPFVMGVMSTWKTMLRSEPKRGALQLAPEHEHGNDTTAIVGLSGPATGTVALRFPPETASAVAGRMLDESSVSKEAVIDAISELVNIVGGAAKAQFKSNIPIVLGLPTVIHGAGYRVEHRTGVRWLAVPFNSDLGSFVLEVAFQPPAGS